jgi:hypothetical protein
VNVRDLLPDAQAELIASPRGTTHVWQPAPGLMVTRVEGVLTQRAALVIEHASRRQVADHGQMTGYHDWEQMTDYETEARVRLVAAGTALGKALRGVHVLVTSRVVALALQGANLVLGNVIPYTSRTAFEAALREALPRRRGER